MAKTNVGQFDTTAANNTDVDSVSTAEGMSPKGVNNAIRALMALIAEWANDLEGGYTAAGTNTYTLTTSTVYTANTDIHGLVVKFTNANTGAATLNVDSIGAVAIKKNGGSALVSGDIAAASTHFLVYDGTDFEIVGSVYPGFIDSVIDGLADGSIIVGDGAGAPVALAAFSSSTGNLLAAKGGTIGQQTIWVPAGAMEPRVTTAPAVFGLVEIGTSLIALRTMDFATDADDFAGFAVQMPKGWDAGTVIAQFIWSTNGTQTGGADGVAWFIRGGSYASDDVLTGALGTAVGATAQDHSATANDVMITAETGAITIANATAEEWVYFEVYRDVSDAGDDLDIDARLHGVKIHYTIDAGNDS